MTQDKILIHQQELLLLFITHYIELSLIGLFGGFVSYILDYYIQVFKQHDNVKFEGSLLFLHGILGGFASFTILALYPSDNLSTLIGFSAIAGLSSVPILTAIRTISIDYIMQKIFKIQLPPQDNSTPPTDADPKK